MSHSGGYDAKDQIRAAVDIVDLIGSDLQLRRQGRGYVAHCPWHDDSRPSLQVNPERQSWKCWVCDIGGDIFSFVMQREGVEFREALRMLAERAGVELQPQAQKQVQPGSPDDKNTLYAAMAWAEEQFRQCLLHASEAAPARQYLAARGINQASIDRYHLGFAPDSWNWLGDRARTTPYSPAVLEATGLVGRSPNSGKTYDRFKGRVIFPIRDTQRRVIAYGGRILPGNQDERAAKYINSPETRLFSKSEQLYGLDVVRDAVAKRRRVIVMEGYTDVVVAAQHGVDNCVAVLGTALTERHIRLLTRFADRITLVLDGDEAGQRRTNEILELFVARQVDLRILTLPEGLDPCDFVLNQGAEEFVRLADGAVDALQHKIRTATAGLDMTTDLHGANRALEEILSTLSRAPGGAASGTSDQRLREHQLLASLARDFRVNEEELRIRLKELRKGAARTAAGDNPAGSARSASAGAAATMDGMTRELLEILLLEPELVPKAVDQIGPVQLPAGNLRTLYEIYCELDAAGEIADLHRVLDAVEDPALANLLITIDWQGREKAEHAADSPAARLDVLIQYYASKLARQEMREVRQGGLGDDAALDVLRQFIERERNRQGISAPTDG